MNFDSFLRKTISLFLSLFLSKIWPTMAPVNGRGLRVTSCFVLHRFKAGLSVRRGCPSVFLCFLAIGRGLNPTFVHVSNLFPVRTLARRTCVCVCDRSIKKKVLKIPFLLIIRYIANTLFNFSSSFYSISKKDSSLLNKPEHISIMIIGRQVSKQRLYKLAITITSESPLLEFVFILPE